MGGALAECPGAEGEDQAVRGQTRFGAAVVVSFHVKISMRLTEERKGHFTGWKIEARATEMSRGRPYKQ